MLSSAKDILSGDVATLLGGADADLITYLDSEKEHVGAELEQCRTEARAYKEELEKLWAESIDAEYELCSVFVHRGTSPSWGHYFFYSRDLPNNPNQWYKYNDSEVTLVGRDEIFKDTTGSTANPYLVSTSVREASEKRSYTPFHSLFMLVKALMLLILCIGCFLLHDRYPAYYHHVASRLFTNLYSMSHLLHLVLRIYVTLLCSTESEPSVL